VTFFVFCAPYKYSYLLTYLHIGPIAVLLKWCREAGQLFTISAPTANSA